MHAQQITFSSVSLKVNRPIMKIYGKNNICVCICVFYDYSVFKWVMTEISHNLWAFLIYGILYMHMTCSKVELGIVINQHTNTVKALTINFLNRSIIINYKF